MRNRLSGHLPLRIHALAVVVLLGTIILCICVGSVTIPIRQTVSALYRSAAGLPVKDNSAFGIIVQVRLPRVLNVALVGAILSLCGAAMQGLLRNPLADGSTLGVSSGASLGAVVALVFGIQIPGIEVSGVMLLSMLFAFGSLLLILALAYALDHSLSTNSIILIGVIFSMFMGSLLSLLISFAGERVRSITFWTMGSLAGTGFAQVRILCLTLAVGGTVLLRYHRELNAFALGEDNARHIGVHVKRVKLIVLITVSAMIGVCVSIGGTIGFVGLVMPHMARMVVGPNHRRLLPVSLYAGAVFLLLADLVARVLLRPVELNIGVVTSFVGAVAFVALFYRTRKGR